MTLEFTPALHFAWLKASGLAVRAKRGTIQPLDLLCGLLAEDEGHAAQRLAAAGLDLVAWKSRTGDDLNLAADETDLAPSPALRLVMTRARHESGGLTQEGSLSTDQVLSALVALVDECRAELTSCGFDEMKFKEQSEPALTSVPLEEPLDLTEPADLSGALRVVDAAANRGREALRVLEDHARFVGDDPFLTSLCKELRHDLAAALSDLPLGSLLAARDTVHDVGTSITTASEGERGSLEAVLVANAKRLQESLRSLEEYGKVLAPGLGERIERLRYRAYTLEKALVLGTSGDSRLAQARLYVLVSEAGCLSSLVGTVRELCEGGVHVIQLREKQLHDRILLARAREIRQLTRRFGVLFILNDRPDIAMLAEADGVHLGQDDLSVTEARRIVGAKALIGVSTHDTGQLRQALLDGANYVGVGPTFPSTTKNFANFPGLEFVRWVAQETSRPAFALGGVTFDNLDDVLAAGATRVAVGHALCMAEDPRQMASRFLIKMKRSAD